MLCLIQVLLKAFFRLFRVPSTTIFTQKTSFSSSVLRYCPSLTKWGWYHRLVSAILLPFMVPLRMINLEGHLQTMLFAQLYLRRPKYQRYVVKSKDAVDVVVDKLIPVGAPQGHVIVAPGLTSTSSSAYIRRFADAACSAGRVVHVVNPRGCVPGVSLPIPRTFCASFVDDLACVVEDVVGVAGDLPTVLVGYSLGANISACLVGGICCTTRASSADSAAQKKQDPVDGFVTPPPAVCKLAGLITLCSPFDIIETDKKFSSSWWCTNVYGRVLAKDLAGLVHKHMEVLSSAASPLSSRNLREAADAVSVKAFDASFVCPMWGFKDPDEYYRFSSSSRVLARIPIPHLALWTDDDPLIPTPPKETLKTLSANCPGLIAAVVARGGHLGFGSLRFLLRGFRGPALVDDIALEFMDAVGRLPLSLLPASPVDPSFTPISHYK